MTQQQIIDGNILIALFDGWNIDNSFPDKDRVYRKVNAIELNTTFKYHSSYGWLIPVIEKIEGMGFLVQMDNYCITIRIGHSGEKDPICYNLILNCDRSKRKAIWITVVAFIKWFNEHEKII